MEASATHTTPASATPTTPKYDIERTRSLIEEARAGKRAAYEELIDVTGAVRGLTAIHTKEEVAA